MPLPQPTLFDTVPEILTHTRENLSSNEAIYKENKVKLMRNSRILLWCMLEGQHLTGLKINHGVQNSAMTERKIMTEYRKRFDEIGNLIGQHNLKEKVLKGGHKEWWIEDATRGVLAEKYKDIPKV